MTLVWERPAARPRTVPIDRAAIVAAAMGVADADGLDAVTLRRVASDLRVLPMRLYGHLDTKDDLLDLMIDDVYGMVRLPAPNVGWRSALARIARELRSAAEKHPWAVSLLGARPPYGPNGLRLVERIWSAIDGQGGDAATSAGCAAAFIGYLTGALQQERGGPEPAEVERYLAGAVATGPYPALAKAFASLTPPDTFQRGLDITLDGIATALASGSAR